MIKKSAKVKLFFIISILLSLIFISEFYSDEINKISILAVGDMVFPYYYENGIENFTELHGYFNNDLNLGNLEGPITYSNTPSKNTSSGKMFVFRFSPDIVPNLLKYLNFKGVLVSNNHANDYGEKGFTDTLKYLKNVDIEPIGLKYHISQLFIKNRKIALVGFYYNSNFNDLRDITTCSALIKKAKQFNDMVIVFFHGGSEGTNAKYVYNKTEYFGNENRGNIFAFCHSAIDSGADLVLGSGPHILRGLELYKSKLIAYSLGNFVASGGLSNKGELSISCILTCNYDLITNNFLEGKILPIDLTSKNPRIDKEKKAIAFIKNLTNQIYIDNFKKNPDIYINDDGSFYPYQ